MTIDRALFERSLEMIIRALHFHVFQKRLMQPMRIHTTLLLDMESAVADANNQGVKKFCAGVRELVAGAPPVGTNPDIFWFKYQYREQSVGWHMSFYGCHRPAYRSQGVIGIIEPPDDRHNGATR